ncbi:quinoprotein [Archangium gephyra]|uniref:ELWxxDGT repeat protein n=1 Tax=Archangium gephyra TaxID=48 RepID=UPI0035D4E603
MRYWRALPALLAFATGCAVPLDDEPTADEPPSTLEAAVTWEPCSTTAQLLWDIHPGAPGSDPASLVRGEDGLFFTADDGVHGRGLWVSSGTGGVGTSLVKDLRPGLDSAEPNELTVAGGKVFFTADDGVHGRELWVSDGTPAGTSLVKDIHPSPMDLGPSGLVELNGRVYFAADDGVHGRELWVSDGTAAGTFLVEDLYPGADVFDPASPGSSSPRRMVRTPDALYFVANVGDEVRLWRSVGVPGARPVFEAPEDNVVFSMTPVGSEWVFFLVDNDEGEASLWVTRGTLGSTRELRFFHGAYPHDLTALNGKLYFSAGRARGGLEGEPAGEELWVSDGTVRGTRLLKDIRAGAGDSRPGSLKVMNRRLYFAADDGKSGRELWVSDGTSGGTRLFKDLVLGAVGSSPMELAPIQDTLFFSAETPELGREAWVSNGTPGGTRPLTEVVPGPTGSAPRGFIRSGWDVFFTAEDGAHGREPWALPFRPEDHCRQ